MIERWQPTPEKGTAREEITRITGNLTYQTYGIFYQLTAAGEDLLLSIREPSIPSIIGYYRITPDGTVKTITSETWTTGTYPDTVFGDSTHNCYLFKEMDIGPAAQRYACMDADGHETASGLMPGGASYWQTPWRTPQMHQNTGALYLSLYDNEEENALESQRSIWRKPEIATADQPWEAMARAEELTRARLTVTGGQFIATHQEIATEYSIEVERDALGRVTQKTEKTQDSETTQQYQYDQAGRLIQVATDNTEETYGYDANGNRTHKNNQQIATFDAQDRILQQNGTTYTHNLLGQRIRKIATEGETTYDYDNLGGLRQVKLPDNTTIDYTLDPTGRRIGRKENNQWTHKWIYQDGLNPIAELDENDNIRKAFIYADKGHVPSYMVTYNYGSTQYYRIVSDLLGSVRIVYDLNTGNEVQRIDYDVWGNITSDTNPDFQPFGFAGGLYDNQTKLTRFGARDYDAETGRWTAKDPIGFNGGDTNLYGYVLNDPVNFVDPSGKAFFLIPGVVGGVIGGVIGGLTANPGSWSWSGFAAGAATGVMAGFTAGIGAGIAANAAMAGIADFGKQWYDTGSIDCVDWWGVGVNTSLGALGTGFTTASRMGLNTARYGVHDGLSAQQAIALGQGVSTVFEAGISVNGNALYNDYSGR